MADGHDVCCVCVDGGGYTKAVDAMSDANEMNCRREGEGAM